MAGKRETLPFSPENSGGAKIEPGLYFFQSSAPFFKA